MKRLVATLTIGILVLSFVASLAGALSYRTSSTGRSPGRARKALANIDGESPWAGLVAHQPRAA